MIDPTKTYRTRDGREVRIYAVDGVGPYRVHGAIKMNEGWVDSVWTPHGDYHVSSKDNYDLIEVKPRHKRTVWLNVYPYETSAWAFKSLADANEAADLNRIACIKVDLDFEEGEGL